MVMAAGEGVYRRWFTVAQHNATHTWQHAHVHKLHQTYTQQHACPADSKCKLVEQANTLAEVCRHLVQSQYQALQNILWMTSFAP